MKVHEFQARQLLQSYGPPVPRFEVIDSPHLGMQAYRLRGLTNALGLEGDHAKGAAKIMAALAKIFNEKDCSLAEINPLVLTKSVAQPPSAVTSQRDASPTLGGEILAIDA